jgi:hypothetical protein
MGARDAVISIIMVVSTINITTIAAKDTPLLPRWELWETMVRITNLCLIRCKINIHQEYNQDQ